MNTKPLPTKLLGVLMSASVLSLTMTPAAHARSAAQGGSATYQCQGSYDAKAAATPVTFDLISPPTSVQPGDTLSLSGNLVMTLSNADAQESRALLAQNANLDATNFALVVKVGGKTISLRPNSVVSTRSPIKTPFALTADVSYPDMTVPTSATGSVTINMPVLRDTTDKVSGAPTKVTFTAHLNQDSLLVKGRNYACWADHLSPHATIARIPIVTAPPAHTQAASNSSRQAGMPAAGALGASQGVGAAPLGNVNPPAAVPAPPAANGVPASTAPVSTVQTAAVNAPIPPATTSSKTFVPGWMLALFIALFPAAAIAFAIVQRRRVKRLLLQTTTAH